ncbi:MAG: hypothetical protein LAT63_07265 [Marinobacter sp.]|nr:hypothetical protein [Marinobacter sp.]
MRLLQLLVVATLSLLLVTGCKSSGGEASVGNPNNGIGQEAGDQESSDDDDDGAGDNTDPVEPEERASLMAPAMDAVSAILVGSVVPQVWAIDDKKVRDELFLNKNEQIYFEIHMYCLASLHQAELGLYDGLLGWRNSLPAGVDPLSWMELAAKRETIDQLAAYGERLYAATLRPMMMDDEGTASCANISQTAFANDGDDIEMQNLLDAINRLGAEMVVYRQAVSQLDADNWLVTLNNLLPRLDALRVAAADFANLARQLKLYRSETVYRVMTGDPETPSGMGSVQRLQGVLASLAGLETQALDQQVADATGWLFYDLLFGAGLLDVLEEKKDKLKDNNAKTIVMNRKAQLAEQTAAIKVVLGRTPQSALLDANGKVERERVASAAAGLQATADGLYVQVPNLAGALGLLFLMLTGGLLMLRKRGVSA